MTLPACLLLVALVPTAQPTLDDDLATLREQAVAGYAEFAHGLYAEVAERTKSFDVAVDAFLEAPDAARLDAAKAAWLHARELYGRTEVLRFYDGPIDNAKDGPETLLNAWPLDEAYVDYVREHPTSGIVNDPVTYPNLTATLLTLLNERGGEANVAIGWHAVEFLLWGQDHDPEGPGARPHTDYVDGEGSNAARRREYLRLTTDLLVEHHDQLVRAWNGDGENYRAVFLGLSGEEGVRRALTGMVVLSGFEMSGERLAVAWETQDQEEEHSCFSDNTHVDFRANQEGVMAVWFGAEAHGRGPGLRAVAERVDAALAARIDDELRASLAAIQGMPVPFDRAIQGPDDGPGRSAVLRALLALERQSESLAALGLLLGHQIALTPGG